MAGHLLDEPRRARALEGVEHRVLVVAGDVDEKVEVELASDEGADRQETLGALGETSDPPSDDLLDPFRDAERLERERACRCARLTDVGADLLDEERIARGRAPDAVHETGPRLDVARVDELPDLALAQAPERDVLGDAVVAEVGDDSSQRMVADHLARAIRAEHAERRRIDLAGEVAEQCQRGAIGPVEVVQHEEQRCALGDAAEQGVDRLEHEVALGVGLGPDRLGEVGEPHADVGDQAGEERAAAHEVGADLGGISVPQVLLDGLDERLVRDDVLLVAATEQDGRAVVVDVACELCGEPALADARVAADQHEAALRGVDGARPGRSERLELVGAADEPGDTRRERDREREARRRFGFGPGERDRITGVGKKGRAHLVHLLGAPEAAQLHAAEVAQRDAGRQPIGDELGGGLRDQHLTALPERAQAGGAAQRGTEVVAVLDLCLTGVEAGAEPQLDAIRPRLGRDRLLEREGTFDRVGGTSEGRQRAVPLTLRPRHAPAVRLGDLGCELVVAHDDARHDVRVCFPEVGRALDVGEGEGHDAGWEHAVARRHDAPEEIVRGGRAPDRVGIERTPQDAVQPLRELGREAFPLDLGAGRGRPPRERVHDRRSQPEHVGRRARVHAVSQLGGAIRVGALGDPRSEGGDAEHEPRVAVGRDDDVLGPNVAVDQSRPVLVEVIDGVGDRGQLAENGGHGEAGITAFANDSLHVRSVDPVHDENVAVVEEEVVAYDGKRRMRPQLQERAPLGAQRLARLVGSEPAHLQRDEAVVPAVDRLHHLAVAALPEHLEQLVTVGDKVSHAGIVRAGSRRSHAGP